MNDTGQVERQITARRISESINELFRSSDNVARKMSLIRAGLLGAEPSKKDAEGEQATPTGILGSWEMMLKTILGKVNRAHSDIICLMKELDIKEVK